MTARKLIEQTLALDAAMTKGPWLCTQFFHNRWSVQTPMVDGEADVIANETPPLDGHGIANYRSAAPRLARMLKVALDAMQCTEPHAPRHTCENCEALSAIEELAK